MRAKRRKCACPTPGVTAKQEAAAGGATLYGVDAVDSGGMISMGLDMGTGALGQAWAVGTGGTIIEYNGTSWRQIGMADFLGVKPPTATLYAVSHAQDGTIMAVGAGGVTVRRGTDATWSSVPSGVTVNLNGVAATSATDALAVGDNGTVLHWNGSNLMAADASSFPQGKPGGSLRSIHCYNPMDCWMVGGDSTIWHLSGSTWSKYSG